MKPDNVGAYSSAFGTGESPLMNTINSAANAQSAKVKWDLLMGLNAGIRPDRQSMKDPHPHQQQAIPRLSEHASIHSNLNSGLRMSPVAMNTQFGNANNGSGGYPVIAGDYSGHPSSQYEGLNMNGLYGNNPMISQSMSSVGTSGAMSTAGPPPGLSPHPGNKINDNSISTSSADNGGGGVVPSFMGSNSNPSNSSDSANSNIGRPLDITSMMNTLDFFGPSPASPISSSTHNNNSNWPNGTGLGGGHMHDQETVSSNDQGGSMVLSRRNFIQSSTGSQSNDGQQQHQLVSDNHALSIDSNTAQSKPSQRNVSSPGITGSASTRSVEDLELQVINAKMETQMLENQLNAVIKRNRRKLYA